MAHPQRAVGVDGIGEENDHSSSLAFLEPRKSYVEDIVDRRAADRRHPFETGGENVREAGERADCPDII